MMQKKYGLLLAGLFYLGIFMSPPVLARESIGYAYIESNNIAAAREGAKRDAMRNFVEQEVGVNVRSQSEMLNNMLIRDEVVTNAQGYIHVKRVVREGPENGVYVVVLDLEHGEKPFPLKPEDFFNLSENSSRYGLDLAIISADRDQSKTDRYINFLAQCLNKAGFATSINDEALQYLKNNAFLGDLQLNAGVRQAALPERGEAMAIVRGSVGIARAPQLISGRLYRTIAEVSCQIIGYENNSVDAVALYADAVAKTKEESERKAVETVLSNAVKELSESAARTVQRETRGSTGMGMTIKTVLIFENLVDKVHEPDAIETAIRNCNCRIIRRNLATNGNYQVFVAYEPLGLQNSNDVADMVRRELQKTYAGILPPMESKGVGSVKWILKLRG